MKVTESLVRDLYADDCAVVAHSENDHQRLADSLSAATMLTVSIRMTEVMFQLAKDQEQTWLK